MALKTGGNRLYTSYKVTTDTAVSNTMVVDVTGGTTFSLNVPEGIPFTSGISYNATSTDADPASSGGYGATSTLYLYTT